MQITVQGMIPYRNTKCKENFQRPVACEKIVVHAKENQYVKSSSQQIEIHLNFIGEIEFLNAESEPTPEEIAEQERI
ncbi:MAG: DUF4368 domain-containing protein, partial [Oscillospiraceae bacterium]|nr:DUF4368 domain-containing protein [Oscillospiraceae bacterium]